MPRLLLEDTFGEFILDRSKIVQESTESGKTVRRIAGRVSICDKVNGNGRKYPRSVWENNLRDGSILRKLIETNSAWGTLEHPADGKVDLRSPIAVRLVSLKLEEGGDVTGEIRVLPTPEGLRLQALIDEGYNPTVSTRGYGSIRHENGVDVVCDDYVCEGADVVMKPSVETAVMKTIESVAPPAVVPASLPPSKTTMVTESVPPSPTPRAKAAPATHKTMDLKTIRERLSALRNVDASKLSPQRFSEGMSQFAELHREIAAVVAEDAKLQWEGSQLHEEITEQEKTWSKTIDDTKTAATKLREDSQRLVKVATAVATTALTYKRRLADSVTKLTRSTQLVERLTSRGQGWKQRADRLAAELASLRDDYQLATDGLDLLAEKYNADMTRVGRRVLELEFESQLKEKPEVAKLLKEAKHPNHLVAIRETHLSPKPAATVPAATTTEGKTAAAADKPAETSGKSEKVAEAAPAAPVAAAVVAEGQAKPEPRGPISSAAESMGIARRLSESTAA